MATKYTTSLLLILICTSVYGQWIDFDDETDSRIVITNVTGNNDINAVDDQEKDLAVGDFDRDSRMDLVVVRKAPFSSPGAKTDLLFMNRDGVLTDETHLYAPEFLSDVTDSRDVICIDVNNDDWPDLFVISTFEDQPKLFINQGNDIDGNWQGFEDETSTRLPTITVNPIQFCAGWGGDLTGNNFNDLYMINYAPSGNARDVLLINDGTGNFTDETIARLGDLRNSSFGTGVEFHDVDNDSDLDIIKNLGLNDITPFNTKGTIILYNNGDATFTNWQRLPGPNPYMFTAGDLDDNGMLDFYLVDDAADYVDKITSVVIDQNVTSTQYNMPTNRTDGFGGNVKMVDIDDDGDLDVGLSSVDTDLPPCETSAIRRFIIFENDGLHSGNLTHPYGDTMNPWNVSTYDHDYIDINNDGYMDIILGTCGGYKIFMQESTTLSSEELDTENRVSIKPNPSDGLLTVSLSDAMIANFSIHVYSINGKQLLTIDDNNSNRISNDITIDIRNQISSGIYFLKIKSGVETITKKIIID
ncbi:T9SS type A sorting domain-containing protein [uncultured Psychroserpens sp.]|uniref:T9SS type A sorting domain-containing protein n=1 Tax=uncultured Psychroserpens sp. TaxID=255436 RepID=UPI0026018562|nr:T9SS type A sorting domain-containing protein [uncultured Psychroserpens sp.]